MLEIVLTTILAIIATAVANCRVSSESELWLDSFIGNLSAIISEGNAEGNAEGNGDYSGKILLINGKDFFNSRAFFV